MAKNVNWNRIYQNCPKTFDEWLYFNSKLMGTKVKHIKFIHEMDQVKADRYKNYSPNLHNVHRFFKYNYDIKFNKQSKIEEIFNQVEQSIWKHK